jgi:phosphoribosyl-ATP pyrophosphohydrolase
MKHEPLGPAAYLGEILGQLAKTVDARAGEDPETSWTAKLLAGGPVLAAKKLGEEGVEAALAVASQSDDEVAKEAADVLYHLLVALRSRGVTLDRVAKVLADRQGTSGIAEKASRG